MAVVEHEQLVMVDPLVTQLDMGRGVFPYGIEDVHEQDPEERIRLSQLSLRLGKIALPPHIQDQMRLLTIDNQDVQRAVDRQWLEHSLYIWYSDPRYKTAQQSVAVNDLAGAYSALEDGIVLPFRIRYNDRFQRFDQPAVIFPEDEYTKVSRNPGGLVASAQAKARRKYAGKKPGEPDYVPRNEVNRRVQSAGAKAARSYVATIKQLDQQYVGEHQLMTSLRRQTRLRDPNSGMPIGLYKVKNLDKKRRAAEELFALAAETAAINAGLEDREVSALHRARTRELFGKTGTSRQTDLAWQRQIIIYGRYINARRFKLRQSLFSCQAYHGMYRQFMREIFFGDSPEMPPQAA